MRAVHSCNSWFWIASLAHYIYFPFYLPILPSFLICFSFLRNVSRYLVHRYATQRAHDVAMMSYRRQSDVVLTSCIYRVAYVCTKSEESSLKASLENFETNHYGISCCSDGLTSRIIDLIHPLYIHVFSFLSFHTV